MQEREIRKSVEAIINRCDIIVAIPSIIDSDGGSVVQAFIQFDREKRYKMKGRKVPLRIFQEHNNVLKIYIYAETYKLRAYSNYMKAFLKMCKESGDVRIIGMMGS